MDDIESYTDNILKIKINKYPLGFYWNITLPLDWLDSSAWVSGVSKVGLFLLKCFFKEYTFSYVWVRTIRNLFKKILAKSTCFSSVGYIYRNKHLLWLRDPELVLTSDIFLFIKRHTQNCTFLYKFCHLIEK